MSSSPRLTPPQKKKRRGHLRDPERPQTSKRFRSRDRSTGRSPTRRTACSKRIMSSAAARRWPSVAFSSAPRSPRNARLKPRLNECRKRSGSAWRPHVWSPKMKIWAGLAVSMTPKKNRYQLQRGYEPPSEGPKREWILPSTSLSRNPKQKGSVTLGVPVQKGIWAVRGAKTPLFCMMSTPD